MEDDLKKCKKGRQPQKFQYGRRPQKFLNGRRPQNVKMEDDLDLNLILNQL